MIAVIYDELHDERVAAEFVCRRRLDDPDIAALTMALSDAAFFGSIGHLNRRCVKDLDGLLTAGSA